MPGSNYNAPQYGVKYEFTRGALRCTFNDPTDSDNIGSLTSIDGLDSPEVREQGENLQERDGGIHSDRFFYGRRPITIEGVIHGYATVAARNDAIQKLMDVTNAMRDDMFIQWTPAGGQEVFIRVRRQQPLRIEGLGPVKTFTLGVVSADPIIYSSAMGVTQVTSGGVTIPNNGSATSYPQYTVAGQTAANAQLTINGKYVVSFTNGLLPDYVYLIDSQLKTVRKAPRAGFRRNSFANPNFEKSSGNQYTANGLGTASRNPFAAQPTPGSGWGTHVLSFTGTGASGQPNDVELLNPDGSGYWPFPYLTALTAAFSMLGGPGAPSSDGMNLRIVYYSAANAIVSTDNQTAGAPSTSSWTRQLYTTNSFASGAVKARIYVGIWNDSGSASIPYYIDGVTLEFAPMNTWSDGSWAPPGTGNWYWTGTADDSASFYAPPGVPNTGVGLSGAYGELDLTHTDWAGLPPGNNLVALTNQQSAAYAAIVYRHAWI